MLSPEDKQLIAEYMGWRKPLGIVVNTMTIYPDAHSFDLNDAGLCVEKMVEKGELEDFEYHVIHYHLLATDSMVQWLFNPDNFFSAMASWLRGKQYTPSIRTR